MTCTNTHIPSRGAATVAHVARTLLGLTFVFSGFVKAVDPLGTTYKIEDYLKAFGGFFTDLLPLAQTAAMMLIAVEFVLGMCLLLNVRTGWTAWLSLAFYAVMTPLTLYVALSNPVSDCGCFGDALTISNWQTFWKNVVLLTLVIVLLCTKKHVHTTFTLRIEIVIAAAALAVVLVLMFVTLNRLPFIDFRPYKIGNNIPSLMEYPEDAQPDEYAITFVYEKDGEQREFTLEDYPKNDSSWVFVSQNSRLVKKGYEPPIHDFEIVNAAYEDITYDILDSETEVTLAVMYDLSKTDRKHLDRLDALYQQCVEQDKPFYAVTGSGIDDIIAFTLETGAEYEICTCDPVTLKTIVRANPGIVVIQNGNIIDKYNLKNR